MRSATKEAMATMYVEGLRVSGRPLTLAEVREAFRVGFDTGRRFSQSKNVKRRR
jgi:hypothetical protein